MRLADRLDAPHFGGELDDVERLRGVALGAFHGNDRRQGIVFHHVFAATRKNRTEHAFFAGHQ